MLVFPSCVLRAEHLRAGGQGSLPFTSPSSESYKLPGCQFSTDSRVGPLERSDSTMDRVHGGRRPQERELIQVQEEKSRLLSGHIGGAALWERKAGWTPRREVTDSPRPSVARAPIQGLRVSRERRTRVGGARRSILVPKGLDLEGTWSTPFSSELLGPALSLAPAWNYFQIPDPAGRLDGQGLLACDFNVPCHTPPPPLTCHIPSLG